jgi:hypothetical protein
LASAAVLNFSVNEATFSLAANVSVLLGAAEKAT